MALSRKDAAAELMARRRARKSFREYVTYTNPKYKESFFSEVVCAALDQFIDDMQAGKRPILILAAPPQHGKSELVSRKLPAYLMGRLPDLRIGAASYGDDLAGAMAQDVRRNIASDEHRRLFPTAAEKRKYDINRMGEFTTPGGNGSYIGVGVGAGLTGRPLDCLVAGTLIDTDIGKIPIEELKTLGSSCKVLAYRNGRLGYENIKAFASGSGTGIWRVTTAGGRILEVTGNHRFYTAGGYVKTTELSAGDVLVSALRKKSNLECCKFQKAESEILLSGLCSESFDDRKAMRGLRCDSSSRKLHELLPGMHCSKEEGVRERTPDISSESCGMSDVSERVRIDKSRIRKIFGVLREAVRRSSARVTNEWRRKSEMEKRGDSIARRPPYSKSVPDDPTGHIVQGQSYLRNVWESPEAENRGTSYRRESVQQCVVEFGDAVRSLPQRCASADGWSIEADRVVRIERSREEAVVFDIQVEHASNFFANGILVHNCGIVDDPIRNAKEALSPTTKDGVWAWYQSVFKTRLSERSGQIIMATRWAEDDLSGRVIDLHKGDGRLTVLTFPAINESGEVGYNPLLPEGALVPELHSIEQLREFKAESSDYFWSAMYQQSPKALGGNVFKDSGIRYYLPKELPAKFDKVIASWDATFKDTDGSDFVVGQVWGKAGANSYLLAQVRARMSFTKTVAAVVKLREEWPKTREVLIEDKANGPAVIDTLKASVPGIIPIEPDGSKLARAHAVTSYWEAGNVWLPHPDIAPWVKDLVSELTAFPAAANDDQVDALTQALRRLYPLFNKLKITQEAINKAMGYTAR